MYVHQLNFPVPDIKSSLLRVVYNNAIEQSYRFFLDDHVDLVHDVPDRDGGGASPQLADLASEHAQAFGSNRARRSPLSMSMFPFTQFDNVGHGTERS